MGSAASALHVTRHSINAKKYLSHRSAEIDKQLKQWQSMSLHTIKLILLGAGESGKSTILKQIRIINAEGFSQDELRSKRPNILWNIVDSIMTIVEAMGRLKLGFADPTLNTKAMILLEKFALTISVDNIDNIDPETKEIIKALWADEGLQYCYERRSEYHLIDCAKYFLDEVDRVAAPDYIPTVNDLLHCRTQTTGVVNFEFSMNKRNVRVVDVGGQRSERRKWIHHFDDCHAVIFVTSLSEYDQLSAEDNKTNRMIESLGLFEQICNSVVFEKSSMILFFNKKDLFAEKIKKVPITVVFKDYEGKQTYEDCVPYIIESFQDKNRNENKQIYCHETCATDTDQVQKILGYAWKIIIKNSMKKNGLD